MQLTASSTSFNCTSALIQSLRRVSGVLAPSRQRGQSPFGEGGEHVPLQPQQKRSVPGAKQYWITKHQHDEDLPLGDQQTAGGDRLPQTLTVQIASPLPSHRELILLQLVTRLSLL